MSPRLTRRLLLAATVLTLSALVAPAAAAAPVTWSSPTDLSALGQSAYDPQLAAAPDGTLTAIWTRSDGSNTIVQVASSTDGGTTWSVPTDLSAPGNGSSRAQVTAAPDSTFTAIWTRFDGGNSIIQAASSTDGGTTWSTPTNLSISGQNADRAQVTVAPDGTITAVWYRNDGSNYIIQASSSTDDGTTWSTPTDLSAPGQTAYDPQLAVAPDGTITAIWYRNDGSNTIIQTASSTDDGTTWSTPTDLSAPGRNATRPQMAVAPDGTLTAIWERSDAGNYIIQASSSTDGGTTWSTPTDLSAAGRSATESQLAVAPDGTLTAIWYRFDGSNYIVQASRSTDGGTTWSTPTDLSAAGQNAIFPQMTAAPDGILAATWNRFDGSTWVIQAASSTDGGTTWSTPTDLSAAGQGARNAQVTAAPDGTLAAIWARDDGSNYIIQVSTLAATSAAAPALAATGIDAAPLGLGAVLLLLGGGFVVWRSRRTAAHNAA